MTDKLQEIKDALAKITPGPWQYDCEGDMVWAGTTKNPQGHICDVRGFGENLPMNDNGDFIAKAPEYVEYLLARIEKLEATLKYYSNHEGIVEPFGYGTIDIGKIAREALKDE
jgi:hypothetical protein